MKGQTRHQNCGDVDLRFEKVNEGTWRQLGLGLRPTVLCEVELQDILAVHEDPREAAREADLRRRLHGRRTAKEDLGDDSRQGQRHLRLGLSIRQQLRLALPVVEQKRQFAVAETSGRGRGDLRDGSRLKDDFFWSSTKRSTVSPTTATFRDEETPRGRNRRTPSLEPSVGN